jgi:hypothetical protein
VISKLLLLKAQLTAGTCKKGIDEEVVYVYYVEVRVARG